MEKMFKLSDIVLNENNPRTIKDAKFKKLVQSIKEFPEMMAIRPIIIDENNMNLGGNMRYKSLLELGYTEVPEKWIKKVTGLTEEQKKDFILKDNVSFGEWDFEKLAEKDQWSMELLAGLDIDIPVFDIKAPLEAPKKEELRPYVKPIFCCRFRLKRLWN